MTHRKYNFMTILLLLIFLGQTTAASAMVCKMDFQSGSSEMVMDHANMNHSMSEKDKESVSDMQSMNMDCCQSAGSCSMMGCVVLAVPVNIEITPLKIHTESILPFKVLTAIQVPLSLFRPPINI